MHPFCNTTASSKQSTCIWYVRRGRRDMAQDQPGMDGLLQNMKIGIIIRYDHWAESANQGCRLSEFRKF
jgi:hypothetical protein